MKREIKFRGKRIDTGEWVYGDLLQNGSITHISNFDNGVFRDHYEVDPETVGQFTGLTDKNGLEIWENDTVLYFGLDNVIQWNQLHCCWGLFQYGNYVTELSADWIDKNGKAPKKWVNSEIEVTGNIYDSPELIKP